MTVWEYNNKFLPRISRAVEFVTLFENAIRHMDNNLVDKQEVMRQFELRSWSEETKRIILVALSYYKKHEGIEKIEY